ncbi:hypothetical protein DUNSADRAFT_2142 [Dunaliella salina]|uniref:Uncharacterized protein n=1 Tax=Dunaliella salina TaxID=3046 RepID=A0ABQ7H8C2_DUNSA|nr:hypothetical protein DUNSADRAFT_2142 [Dunaliella salina]|eukprot:KAF5843105.1 hypothetical protein DUNSADRAFT_2142 [Dunaliella salina]
MGSSRQSLSATSVSTPQDASSGPDVRSSRARRRGSSGRHGVGGEEGCADRLRGSSSRREGVTERKEVGEEGEGMLGPVAGGNKRVSDTFEGLGIQGNGSWKGSLAASRKAKSGGDHSKRWSVGGEHSSNGAEVGPILKGSKRAVKLGRGKTVGPLHWDGDGIRRAGSLEQAGFTGGEDVSKGYVGEDVSVGGMRGEGLSATSNGVGGMLKEAGACIRSGKVGKKGMLSSLGEDVLEEPEGEEGGGGSTASQKHGRREVLGVGNSKRKSSDGGMVRASGGLQGAGYQGPGSAASGGLESSGKRGEMVLEESDEDDDTYHGNGAANTSLSPRLCGSQGSRDVGSAPDGGWTSQGAGPLFGGGSGSSGSSSRGMAVAEGVIPLQLNGEQGNQGAGVSTGVCSRACRAATLVERLIPLQHSGEQGIQGAGVSAGVRSRASRAEPSVERLIPPQHSGEQGIQGAGATGGVCFSDSRAEASVQRLIPMQHSREQGAQGARASARPSSMRKHLSGRTGSKLLFPRGGEGEEGHDSLAGVCSSSSRGVPVAEGLIPLQHSGSGEVRSGSSSSCSNTRGKAVAEGVIPLQHSSEWGVQGGLASSGLCRSSSRGVPVVEGLIPLQHSGSGEVRSGSSSSCSNTWGKAVAEGVIPLQHSSEWGVQGGLASSGLCRSSSRGVPVVEGLIPLQHSGNGEVRGGSSSSSSSSSSSCSNARGKAVAEGVIPLQHSSEWGVQGGVASAGLCRSSSRGMPVAEGVTPAVSTLPEAGRGMIGSVPSACARSLPWNASLSLRPYGAAALLCAHRQTLLSCTQLEHVVQICNALPPLPSSPVALASHARQLWHMQHLGAGGASKAAVQGTSKGASKEEPSVLITKSNGVAGSKAAASAQQQQGKQGPAHAAAPPKKPRLPLHKRVLKALTPDKSKPTGRKPTQDGHSLMAASGSSNKAGGPAQRDRERQGAEGKVEGRVGSFPGASTKVSKHGADNTPKRTSFLAKCGCVTPSPLSFSQPRAPNS